MSLTRILLVVGVLYLVWRVLSAYGRRLGRRAAGAEDFSRFSARGRDRRARGAGRRGEELVACSVCGAYVPASRALPIGDGGAVVCSEACRKERRSAAGR